MYKMNRMHLHLTDAAGRRIRIDAYPRLTEFAAWRPQVTWKEWWNGGRAYAEEGTPGIYGGYYTKDEMRELVEYARERHIEVLPEIEMPSHSEEVFAAYPELGCSNEPYKDCDFCVGNEKTFEFLETVLSEVMEIFPYEYIHIGGDEAGKGRWKTCPQCQQRMKEEGLKDVDELQSYLIRRIEKFVNSKGRKIIGWDEILEGGLAPDATVMSWRGTEGGIEAMRQGHDVIMSPGKYCYLDHAQDATFKGPESIGGYLPLENVYGYEPVEASMPSESLHHLIGVQANLWTEYITADEHAEYMYWPRALAIAETGWSRPEAKDYADFKGRVMTALDMLRSMGYSTFDLENEYGERKLAQTGVAHKAVGAAVTYNIPINKSYPGAGETTLTDGVIGGWTYSDGRWQGFLSDIDVTLDLGEVMPVHYVGGSFMQLTGPYVFMPKKVEIYVSEDGENFTRIAEVWNDVSQRTEELVFRNFDTICDVKARFVRYKAETSGVHGGWIFLDEIIVN
jgi:hexosaminidase